MKKNNFSGAIFSCLLCPCSKCCLKNQNGQGWSLESKVITWRRDFHQNPELGNREFKTAEKIATHLRSLGIEVQTGIAKTGVVGILRGGKPGPVVALSRH
jgi:metal-dependent amidase/aminoacylase/carboxypeptidase family protein